jgi:hypothetical protein
VPANPSTYCLRIAVLDSDPSIWRRFCLDAHRPLRELHPILAAVMGWSGEADYRFKLPQRSGQDLLHVFDTEARTCSLTLADLVTDTDDSFFYTYNLSQGWIHSVTLETLGKPEATLPVPYCLEGEQACPPEFCEGVWGYEELLDRLDDPDDAEYDILWQRVGYGFDPARFDLDAVNQRLRGLG